MQDLLGIVLRVSIMYCYALFILRLTGKRSVGSITPLDFVVALVIGDLFDNVFWNTTPLANGLLAITVIFFLHGLVAVAISHSPRLDHLLTGAEPVRVVNHGRFDRRGLASERTREDEVRSELRIQGEEDLSAVREAFWEPNGQLSILRKEKAKPAQKQDLDALREELK